MHKQMGMITAIIGGNPNTKLDGPNSLCKSTNATPKITPVKIRWPIVTLRSGPNTKEIAIKTKLAVAIGCNIFCQKAKL